MTDEEIDAEIEQLETCAFADRRRYEQKIMALIKTLRKERDTYRFLLERETRRCWELLTRDQSGKVTKALIDLGNTWH